MNLIIVPDIFGLTPALKKLTRELEAALKSNSHATIETKIVSPYPDEIWFEEEQKAYAYFTDHLDIVQYSNRVKDGLEARNKPAILLGFSAGASAVWQLAGTCNHPLIIGAMGFYGSQIRNFTHLIPFVQTELIFPASESHFDVNSLMAVLAEKPNTLCEQQPGGHGFMNALSRQFHPGLYEKCIREILPQRLNRMILTHTRGLAP